LIVRIEVCKVAENDFNRRTRDKGRNNKLSPAI
jgi:hypothetical protein